MIKTYKKVLYEDGPGRVHTTRACGNERFSAGRHFRRCSAILKTPCVRSDTQGVFMSAAPFRPLYGSTFMSYLYKVLVVTQN